MDKIVFMEKTHPNKVIEGLNRLRLNNSFCDVIICCGGKEFPCHRNVLASFSPYFEAMFTTGMVESRQHKVNINDVESEEFSLLVNFAYTSTVDISTANVQALLAAANLFNVAAVKEACSRFLEHHVMDEQNCVGIHLFAETHSCKTLEQHSMDYILDHFSDVYQQDEYLSVSVDKLTEILASDDLNAPKEEMVFEAAMLWLNKCPTRRQSLEKVFELIRLPLISPSYLHDVIESVDVVQESQGCQRLISEAKNQDLLPSCHTAQPRSSTVILMVGGRLGQYRTGAIDIVESYDPLTNQRKILAPLPERLYSHGLVVLGTKVYLAGGRYDDDVDTKQMWCYDASHDSWLQMAPMNEARSRFGLVAVGGYVFAIGGFQDDFDLDSVERYNPTNNTWQLVESDDMRKHYNSSSFVALDGLIYTIGMEVLTETGTQVMVHTYNPETSVWKEVAPLQGFCSTACTLKGRIYVIGVESPDHGTDAMINRQMQCYNPKTNQWTMCAPMKKERYKPGVAVVGGMIYIIGGQEDGLQCTIERYCEQ